MDKELQFKMAKDAPFYHHVGIEVLEINHGFAKLGLNFKDCLTHPFGFLHGGVIASLADSAGINSVFSVLRDDENALTLEMKINFLSPVKDANIYAEGKVIHKGRKIAVSDVEVKKDGGQLVAKALVTCTIF
jgi:acyl-CoA thioesterase